MCNRPIRVRLKSVALSLLDALTVASAKERAYYRTMETRPLLDDEAFYQAFYAESGVAPAIPSRLRALIAHQLGHPWKYIYPGDRPPYVMDELDFWDLVLEVNDEFDVCISLDEANKLDTSFDSLVRIVARKLESARKP